MPETKEVAGSALGDVLSQKPLIKQADTRTLIDKARESGQSFGVVFEEGVRNMTSYKTEVPSPSNGNGNGNGNGLVKKKESEKEPA